MSTGSPLRRLAQRWRRQRRPGTSLQRRRVIGGPAPLRARLRAAGAGIRRGAERALARLRRWLGPRTWLVGAGAGRWRRGRRPTRYRGRLGDRRPALPGWPPPAVPVMVRATAASLASSIAPLGRQARRAAAGPLRLVRRSAAPERLRRPARRTSYRPAPVRRPSAPSRGPVPSFRRQSGRAAGGADCGPCRDLRAALANRLRGLLGLPGRALARLRPARETDRDLLRRYRRRTHPGSRDRRYQVHLPPGYRPVGRYPLVVVLHGCRQTEADIRRVSNFDAVADEAGCVVVYPFVTDYSGVRSRNCWGWWFRNEIRRGAGEVEDLWGIVEEVCAEFPIDRARIHVAGLSSGGGMAVAMMVCHARRIASGAVVAGVPYGESAGAVTLIKGTRARLKPVAEIRQAMNAAMGQQRRLVPVFIVHSDGDHTVPIQAACNIRDSWRQCFHVPLGHTIHGRVGITHGTPWEHRLYRDADRRSVIETLFLEGKDHGWYGGQPGAFSYPDAPDISRLMWTFFRDHPLPYPAPARGQAQAERGS